MQPLESAIAKAEREPMRRLPHVLLCGRIDAPEFSIVRRELARQLPESEPIRRSPPLDSQFGENATWDLIVVCQSDPDELTADQVRDLLSCSVSSRLIVCSGNWCLSEGRTRSLWPLAVVVPVERFSRRLAREMGVWRGQANPIPLTAAAEEVFAAECASPSGIARMVRVVSSDAAYRATLVTALRQVGCCVLESEADESVDVVLIDIDPWDPVRAGILRSLHMKHPKTRFIALTNYPVAMLSPPAAEAGADVTVGKASGIPELAAAILATDERTIS